MVGAFGVFFGNSAQQRPALCVSPARQMGRHVEPFLDIPGGGLRAENSIRRAVHSVLLIGVSLLLSGQGKGQDAGLVNRLSS